MPFLIFLWHRDMLEILVLNQVLKIMLINVTAVFALYIDV